jgi:hypothetical protein
MKLLPGLEVLEVALTDFKDYRYQDEYEPVDVAAALFEAARPHPKLHTLALRAAVGRRPPPQDDRDLFCFGSKPLAKFLKASPALTTLKITGEFCLTLEEVEQLSSHPALRRLVVRMLGGGWV